jgi:hypothetical protein
MRLSELLRFERFSSIQQVLLPHVPQRRSCVVRRLARPLFVRHFCFICSQHLFGPRDLVPLEC